MDENSSMLWHKHLGHISLERIKRLVKEEILRNIDFVDFSTCIECIKESILTKLVKVPKEVASFLKLFI